MNWNTPVRACGGVRPNAIAALNRALLPGKRPAPGTVRARYSGTHPAIP